MSLKRYFATADNSITNAYKPDGQTRATNSNTGEADILEVFMNYGDVQEEEREVSRILIQFDIDKIKNIPLLGVDCKDDKEHNLGRS